MFEDAILSVSAGYRHAAVSRRQAGRGSDDRRRSSRAPRKPAVIRFIMRILWGGHLPAPARASAEGLRYLTLMVDAEGHAMSMNEVWLLILGGVVVAFVAWRMLVAGRAGRRPSAAGKAAEDAAGLVARHEAERAAVEEDHR